MQFYMLCRVDSCMYIDWCKVAPHVTSGENNSIHMRTLYLIFYINTEGCEKDSLIRPLAVSKISSYHCTCKMGVLVGRRLKLSKKLFKLYLLWLFFFFAPLIIFEEMFDCFWVNWVFSTPCTSLMIKIPRDFLYLRTS